ncbi:MAG: YbaK/EbsC family protein, partial [Myxococcota bacterium]|nr:YbaK/EbsC family protein [Myxococcota bacterium]
MSIASRVKWFLDVNRVRYEVVAHPPNTEADAASPGPIPPGKIARAVLLEDDAGYLMPILPAGRRLNLDKLRAELARDLKPATSEDALSLFFDCDA